MTARTILFVNTSMEWFWSHRLPLAMAARDAGFAVHVAGPAAASDAGLGAYGLEGHDIPALENRSVFRAFPLAIMALRRIVTRIKPDLVHAIGLKTVLVAGPAVAARRKAPACVYTLAGLGQLFGGAGLKIGFYRALATPVLKAVLRRPRCAVIFQNNDDKVFMESLLGIGHGDTVLIRGSGVDLGVFAPVAEPETGAPVVLLPCRLLQDKGVIVFAKAAEILAARGVPARFVVAGGIDRFNPAALTENDMENLTRSYPLEWAGKVTDMPALYAACALVAYPSWYKEGVPKALIEAAACGRAIVTTDHPGCRDVVDNGVNGILVPVRDEQALASAVETLLLDPGLRRTYGTNGRAKADEFRIERVIERTLAVYATVLRG